LTRLRGEEVRVDWKGCLDERVFRRVIASSFFLEAHSGVKRGLGENISSHFGTFEVRGV